MQTDWACSFRINHWLWWAQPGP